MNPRIAKRTVVVTDLALQHLARRLKAPDDEKMVGYVAPEVKDRIARAVLKFAKDLHADARRALLPEAEEQPAAHDVTPERAAAAPERDVEAMMREARERSRDQRALPAPVVLDAAAPEVQEPEEEAPETPEAPRPPRERTPPDDELTSDHFLESVDDMLRSIPRPRGA